MIDLAFVGEGERSGRADATALRYEGTRTGETGATDATGETGKTGGTGETGGRGR